MFAALRNLGAKCGSNYQKALTRHPYVVQAVQVGFLMGSGDVIAQIAVEKKEATSLDLHRTAKFVGLGFFLVGPTLRFWYGQLERIVRIENPVRRTIGKMCLDQFCFAPSFMVVFTTTLSTLQGMNLEEITQRLKRDYISIMKMNYCIWPAAQLINFGLVPLNYQVIFVQFVAMIWNTYLSAKLGDKNKGLAVDEATY